MLENDPRASLINLFEHNDYYLVVVPIFTLNLAFRMG